jgi:glycosyltransferase involved in cell wall biosynthesis
MDICLVTNRVVRGEGQGRVNYEIARRAATAGHRVTCVAHDVSPDLHVHPRISWVFMPDAEWPLALLGNLRFAWRSTRWLRTYGEAFDLTIGNGCITWFPVDVNVVHFVHSAWMQSPVHDARQQRGPRSWYQWLYSRVNASLEARLLPRAGVVVAVSETVKHDLEKRRLAQGPIRVIHNGVDLEEFSPGAADRGALGLPPEVPLAFFAGDIRTPRKNLDSVLRALAEVPSLHLAVAGSTDRSPFPALAEDLGVDDRTHFLGFRRDVAALMRAADLLAFPSRYEACALVLLEAMASGLPIVTARTTGGAELLGEDCGVVLDDPDDVSRLAEVLRRLVDEPALRRTMGTQARARAEDLSWSAMAKRYLGLMEEVAASDRHSAPS